MFWFVACRLVGLRNEYSRQRFRAAQGNSNSPPPAPNGPSVINSGPATYFKSFPGHYHPHDGVQYFVPHQFSKAAEEELPVAAVGAVGAEAKSRAAKELVLTVAVPAYNEDENDLRRTLRSLYEQLPDLDLLGLRVHVLVLMDGFFKMDQTTKKYIQKMFPGDWSSAIKPIVQGKESECIETCILQRVVHHPYSTPAEVAPPPPPPEPLPPLPPTPLTDTRPPIPTTPLFQAKPAVAPAVAPSVAPPAQGGSGAVSISVAPGHKPKPSISQAATTNSGGSGGLHERQISMLFEKSKEELRAEAAGAIAGDNGNSVSAGSALSGGASADGHRVAIRSSRKGGVPTAPTGRLQLIPVEIYPGESLFCSVLIKRDNRRKHNSHAWFLSGFAPAYESDYIFLTDCGTVFSRHALFHMFKELYQHPTWTAAT